MTDHHLPHHHEEETKIEQLQAQLDKIEDFRAIAEVFAQLGDPTRTRIFWMLCHCEECVIDIAAMMNMSSPAVSHHLRTLRSSGLITSVRKGKEVFYHVADTETARLLHHTIEQVMTITCPDGGNQHE